MCGLLAEPDLEEEAEIDDKEESKDEEEKTDNDDQNTESDEETEEEDDNVDDEAQTLVKKEKEQIQQKVLLSRSSIILKINIDLTDLLY